MSEICKATFRFTREELIRAMLHRQRMKLRRGFLLLAKIFAVLVMLLFGMSLVVSILFPSGPSLSFWVLLPFPVCIYCLMFDRANAWYWGRGFAKRPDANIQVEFQFSKDGMRSQTELVDATVHWKAFLRVVETSDGFLFYQHKNLFCWLPFSAFEFHDCIERVRGLVSDHGIPLIGPVSYN